ncbi:MAG: universal stress protein [Actinobacteria bacterium]|nr:universal stress protein [Actinomycetota bacterium]
MVIVVAYTPDSSGEAALAYGIAEAKRRDAKIVVVNATRGDALVDPRFAGESAVGTVDSELASMDHEITQPIGPDVSDLIISEVERTGAGYLVVGLRHRTPVGKLIMGSVSQRLLLDSPVPVFAVRPPRD